MADYSQKWHNGTSTRNKNSNTFDGLAAIQAQLNNLSKEIKKVNEKVYAAQFEVPFPNAGRYRAVAPGFYQRDNGNPSYQERRQTMEESLSKFMVESVKRHDENSSLINEIRASTDAAIRNQRASIKALKIQIGQMSKRMELDLDARLMGEALILNRSQDYEFGDFLELNDLNEPLELRNHKNEDLSPTIEEEEIVDEPMVDVVKIRTQYGTNKKNNVKARSLLLMALPNEHQLTFSQYTDAKTMFAAIETRFGESLDSIFNRLQKIVSRLAILGVVITQEDLNSKFLTSLPPEWNTHVVVWMNKAEIKTMSIDDLYNNFKIVKQSVKKSVSASNDAQNLAFMTAPSTSSTNDVNTAKPAYEVSTVSPNDLEQIHEDDLKAMDLKWQLSLLSMRTKRYFQRTGKKIFINANDTAGYDKPSENIDKASKGPRQVVRGQKLKKIKRFGGIVLIPPPHPLIYNRPKKLDLSYSGLDEFKEPEFKGYGTQDNFKDLMEVMLHLEEEHCGRISGKGTLKTDSLDFEDVYFANELKFNLLMSHIYDCYKSFENWTKNLVACLTMGSNTELLVSPREKGIRREYSIARTPQQNSVAERRNRTLIEAVRTMLADSKLPITFWAEAVSTAFYVQNRVLVVKPHNKTPYQLFRGFKPALSFMRPFGCHVTILNTLDNLGKFDGKSDEENKPMIEGNSLKWLFDIDSLTKSMNYEPVAAGTITNESADASYFDSPSKDVGNGEPKSATDD
ncbi:ribonuclease H-like domain-containing protein, partial [Tanacetum coccineum]